MREVQCTGGKVTKLIAKNGRQTLLQHQKRGGFDEYAKILYHDELKYFVDCVESKAACMNNVLESRYLLEKLFSGHNKL